MSIKLVCDLFLLFTCLVLGYGPVELTNRHYIVVDTESTVHVTHENLITLMSLVSQHSAVGTQHWRRNFVKS
jgi:thiosulfate reductase cytochrome b subunit